MPDGSSTAVEAPAGDEAPVLAPDGTDLVSAPVAEATRPPFGIIFWICVGWLVVLTVITVFANLMHFQNPNTPDYSLGPNSPASLHHWLGTDEDGRDILARLVFGGRVSLVIGLAGTAIGVGIGGALGMLAAYARGWLDQVLSYAMYTALAFPAIIAVLAVLSFWGVSEVHIIIVLGIAAIPLLFRLVRGATLACATKEYVVAAKSQGATSRRVLLFDIFPNIAPALITYTVITFGGIIVTEGALGFLGFSVNPATTPSWGNMIGGASANSSNYTYVFGPAIALFLTLVTLYYIGERIRLHFDTGELKI